MNILDKLNTKNPYKIIEFIDDQYPNLKGMCYYDKTEKILKSKSGKHSFYFDPNHAVLEINTNND